MIQTRSVIETYKYLSDKLDNNSKLYYTRFGDGEILSMMGKEHRNYKSSPELSKELIESFTINDPLYLKALSINYPIEKMMQAGVFVPYSFNNELIDYLENNNYVKNDGWHENPIMFHYLAAFKPKLIYDLFEKHIRSSKKVFIGCTPKKTAERLYGKIDFYVTIPPKHAYNSINEWWPKVMDCIDKVTLVIPSAGAATNVISKRLWKLNKNIHLLDIGSLIDAVEGNNTRTWIRLVGHKTQKVLNKENREKSIKKRIVFVLKDIKYFFRKLVK